MPDEKEVRLSTLEGSCDDAATKYIKVDKDVIVLPNKNTVMKFYNDLDTKAEIRFFPLLDKGDSSKLINDFCPQLTAGVLKIDSGHHKNCKADNDGHYAYTVKATGYQDLDPVVIIEPLAFSVALSFAIPLLALTGFAAFAGFAAGKYMASKKNQEG